MIRKIALTGGIATGKSHVANRLREAGVPNRNIKYDDANARIPLPTQTGNLIVGRFQHDSARPSNPRP